MNRRSFFPVFIFLAITTFAGLSYSVLMSANPVPLTSPTFELNSNTTQELYTRSATLVLSGTSVSQVNVAVYNKANTQKYATLTVQIYNWDGNLVAWGKATVTIPGREVSTVSITLSSSVPYSSIGRVVVSVS